MIENSLPCPLNNDAYECPSDLVLTRIAEQLEGANAGTDDHIDRCGRCRTRVQALRDDAALFGPQLPDFDHVQAIADRRQRAASRWPLLAGALALAASLVAIWWSPTVAPELSQSPEGIEAIAVRSKGGPSIGLYLRRNGRVMDAGNQVRVRIGDEIRFYVNYERESQLAIVAVDANGHAEIYHKVTALGRTAGRRRRQAMETAFAFDEQAVDQTVYALFCRDRDSLDASLATLTGMTRAEAVAVFAGCDLATLHIEGEERVGIP